MKTHVVVTLYTRPTGKLVVNVYGPYTISKARAERNRILADAQGDVIPGSLLVVTRRAIDIDEMNRMASFLAS